MTTAARDRPIATSMRARERDLNRRVRENQFAREIQFPLPPLALAPRPIEPHRSAAKAASYSGKAKVVVWRASRRREIAISRARGSAGAIISRAIDIRTRGRRDGRVVCACRYAFKLLLFASCPRA